MHLETVPQRLAVVLGLPLVGLYAWAMAWAFETQSYNVWGSLLVAPIVVAVDALIVWRVSLVEDDPWIVRLLGLGLVLKMLGSVARYFTIFVLYNGVGDAARYNVYASYQHVLWRQGQFVWDPAGKMGTQNLELVTTAVYTVIGPAPLAGFFVFASLAFWGCYLLYRAFRVAVPAGHHRLYAAMLFLLPSLLFWPSSIGKEAWLMLWLGVLALGAAKFFTQGSGALLLLALGILGTAMIRPHLTVLLAAGLLVAQFFRPVGNQAIGALYKAFGIAVLVAAGAVLATQSADFLGIDDLSVQSVTERVDWAGGQTEQGGSAFTPVPLSNPFGIPAAIITLLFRPFPWEASGVPMLVQSLEGLLLIGLLIKFWPRVKQLPRILRTNPYVVFALVYALAFIIAFSGFGNFGILARQRTLMFPLFAVLLCLPAASATVGSLKYRRARRAI